MGKGVVSVQVWAAVLNAIISRSFPVLAIFTVLVFFTTEHDSIVSAPHPPLPSVDGHLGWVDSLARANRTIKMKIYFKNLWGFRPRALER